MNILLSKLHLRNFKGVEDFALEPGGEDITVLGDNGTGKTTLADAISWLLFDKDSQFNSKFEIKTLDTEGNQKHNLEHEVSVVFLVNNNPIELQKTLTEKWTKKRGATTSEFTGHTTGYKVDGVPVKQKEFKDRVAEIASDNTFKLLTSTYYFSQQMKWHDRRALLLEICGDVEDQEVINSKPELQELSEILGKRSIDDHRKVVESRRKEINKELDRIPVRIDEVQRSLEDVSNIDVAAKQKELKDLQKKKEDAEAEKNRLRSGGQAAELKKQLAEVEAEVQRIKNKAQADVNEKIGGLNEQIGRLEREKTHHIHEVHNQEKNLKQHQGEYFANEKRMEELRAEWATKLAKKFEPGEDKCPTCGQDIPEGDQEKAFNTEKANALEKINQEGKKLKARNEDLVELINACQHNISAYQETIKEYDSKLSELREEVKRLEDPELWKNAEEYQDAVKQQAAIQEQIDNLESGDNEKALADIDERIQNLNTEIQTVSETLNKVEQARAGEKRIENLATEEKTLSQEFEKLERELWLMDEFVRTRVSMLEGKVNDKFQIARFKMFAEQVNGGLTETCEVTYQGVPYNSGLNHGAQIAVGMDIINTLSEYYGVRLPVIVDNAEAITNLPEIDSQIIRLVVSDQHQKLTAKTATNIKEQAA